MNVIIQVNETGKFDLIWNKIHCQVPDSKTGKKISILKGVSGGVKNGQILAILGGSGAGKSTLLNALACLVPISEGSIFYQNRFLPSNWQEVVGYVKQNDPIMENVTVREAIEFSAGLRLPKSLSAKEMKSRVDETLEFLGIAECSQRLLKTDGSSVGVSGGQLKRTSIGIEAVTKCRVLLLDEPTSGLDAASAQSLVEKMKLLAKEENSIVILTIHQPRPEIFSLFDKVLFLTQGRDVFFGGPEESISYFTGLGYPLPEFTNPADFLIDLITLDFRSDQLREGSQQTIDNLIAVWSAREPICHFILGISRAKWKLPLAERLGLFSQFKRVLRRDAVGLFREKMVIFATIGQALFISFLTCAVFFQIQEDQSAFPGMLRGVLFLIVINSTFSVALAILPWLPLHREIITRETYARMYPAELLYISKCITNLPVKLAGSLLFNTIVYWIVGFRSGLSYFLKFNLVMFCLYTCSVFIGLGIGACTTHVKVATIVAPVLLMIFMFFGGGLVNTDTIGSAFRWIKYTSLNFWAFRGLFISQLSDYPPNPAIAMGAAGFSPSDQFFTSPLYLLAIAFISFLMGLVLISHKYVPKLHRR